jgi:DNA invertase Pin-like site-specific DNA recombinase
MMKHIAGNGVRTILVETASRFARDLIVQETGWRFLKDAGITLIAVDSPDALLDDTPTAVMIRQILGSVSQFEKAMLVAKLKGARDRKKTITGKCGGRKSYEERSPPATRSSGRSPSGSSQSPSSAKYSPTERDGRAAKEAGAVSRQCSQAIIA